MLSRYVTLAVPLLIAVYFSWLAYGRTRVRVSIHGILLALVILALPEGHRYSRKYGRSVLVAQERVEEGLKEHVPTPILLKRACPVLFPDRRYAHECFKLLKAARMGRFVEFEDDRVATAADPGGAVRR